jgi:hypothetical protein
VIASLASASVRPFACPHCLADALSVAVAANGTILIWDRCKEATLAERDAELIGEDASAGLERYMFELLTIVPAAVAMSLGTRSILKSRERRQRSERRRQRHKREAGIWWAMMWLSKDKRQKKLTYRQD